MKSRRLASVLAAGALALSCRGPDLDFECDDFAAEFEEVVEKEGRINPIEEVPTWGPYPVTMVLTADGINALLGSQVDTNIPFTGDLTFGPTNIHFEPISAPTIEIAPEGECAQCVYFSLDFVAELVQNNQPVSAGIGHVVLEVPIELAVEESGASALIGRYDEADIIDLQLAAFGFDSEEHEALGGALAVLMEESVHEQFGSTKLLELSSFGLGSGDAQLLAREMFTYADTQTITIGMHTNLVMPEDFGLDPHVELPVGVKMGFHFSTALLLGMSRRMLAEGEIPRRYNENGDPDENGIYSTSIDGMAGRGGDSVYLDSMFRVWRLADAYCGYAVVELPLAVELNEETAKLSVTPGEVVVLSGEGVGAIAAKEEELVTENAHLVEVFKAELADAMDDTLEYSGLSMEGKVIVFETLGVEVGSDAVATRLDFVVVDAP